MDIAKYIGLFLLKNNFCYVPGIGNLEIKKRPAIHDGQNLQAPAYDIVVTPGGSIDDTLANFIATNEKISIASASNAVRSFVTETRAALHEGKQVALPSLGHFIEEHGKLYFVTDPAFKYAPPAIPTIKNATKTFTQERSVPVTNRPEPVYNQPTSRTHAGRMILIAIVSGILLAFVIKGISYLYSKQEVAAPADTVVQQAPPVQQPVSQPAVTDTITKKDTTASAANTVAASAPSTRGEEHIKVIINTFSTRDKAEKRAHKLTTFGNTVEMIAKDSTTFFVVVPVSVTAANKEHVLDSLRGLFNPKGVSVY
jgi:hypothetical protein